MLPAGRRLGPYEIVSLIGAGGMGEVYRARDPRLGRDVALKVIRGEPVEGADRLQRFEREARAAASLNHPNILTVHDVGTDSGIAYVVTELLDGETLRAVLSRRSPGRSQILSCAVQAAHGLAAAHQKGVVHRDFKPENLFLTADGRVKILDFGLAKVAGAAGGDSERATDDRSTRPGVLMGTVAYMSPEQVKALAVDAQSDIFSFGVVLYELLSRRHPFRRDTVAATLTAILQETPPDLTSLDAGMPPVLSGIVRRCLEKEKGLRFQSAHDLALALEAVMALPSGTAPPGDAAERSPYPGLASFTEKDAAVFFGRETEVEAVWRRLQSRQLVAVIAPSGTGKTSFVRAGVIASRPAGWGALVCAPGAAPFRSLGRALAPELAGDPEALRQLVSFDEAETAVDLVGRWRRAHGEALFVVDPFEELFTLSPRDSQERFATLLGRLAQEVDVHVLLCMRDDFLVRCSEHQALAPVFETISPLPGLGANGLRRALVEPAGRRGYRFEDGSLVEEMIQSVEGSRGALPLLAFAMARLWEMRDRDRKLLTRRAYEEIGGVAGALAQHAEAAIERIGSARQSIVREIFRNLVTADGTRAVADCEELLTLSPGRADVADVLGELIDARLLTSYEVEGVEGRRLRVEVVHESLLEAWPRLVRWRAQDEEGAVLRDQLKQAAHLWEDKGRTPDLLWTGTAYREFELWRERYAGALTAVEEDFARSMSVKARRRKRLWTAAVASVIVALAGIAVAIGVSRQQAASARDRAQTEALRAEAGKLLALGRAEIDRHPTAALAHARKSLELADTPEARRFAVEVLWRGPVARILSPDRIVGGPDKPERDGWYWPAFSPDANWLALQNEYVQRILLVPRDGGAPRSVPRPRGNVDSLGFGPRSDLLVAGGSGASLQIWSLPELREAGRIELGGVESTAQYRNGGLYTLTRMAPDDRYRFIRSWSLPGGEARMLGTVDWEGIVDASVDPPGRSLVYASGRSVYVRALEDPRETALLGNHTDVVSEVALFPGGDGVASVDKSGEIRLWPLGAQAPAPRRVLRGQKSGETLLAVDGNGTHLARAGISGSVHLWDLRDPPDTEPVVLKRPDFVTGLTGDFDPSGRWLVASTGYNLAFWPVGSPWRRVLPGYSGSTWGLAFTPDGRWLASCALEEPVRLWPLSPAVGRAHTLVPAVPCWGLKAHPASTHVLVTTWPEGRVVLLPIAGGAPRPLRTGWEGAERAFGVAFDSRGRRAAACAAGFRDQQPRVLSVWDLETGEGRTFSLAPVSDASWSCESLAFAPDGAIFVGGDGGVLRLVLPDGQGGAVSPETVHPAGRAFFALSRNGRKLLVWAARSPGAGVFEELLLFDLASHSSRRITTHGRRLFSADFDPTGRLIVSGDIDGVVRVGPATGEEPHLLPGGHTGLVTAVTVSADGRWIASVSDEALCLWPMPDVSRPPLHTLAHAELMAKLDALTNLRVVRDAASSTGWKVDVGPFPGWQDVPTW